MSLAIRSFSKCWWQFYAGGLIANALAFYWLCYTIEYFGHFPTAGAAALFALFVLISSLQFALVPLLRIALPKALDKFSLRLPIAWTVAENISIRIFPWHLGHTQANFIEFAQLASLGGAMLITFLMVWIVELILDFKPMKVLAAAALTCFILAYGMNAVEIFSTPSPASRPVALIQGNVSIEEKRDTRYFTTNEGRYRELSKPFLNSPTLVIWPESVVQRWIPEDAAPEISERELPSFPESINLLFGGLSFNEKEELFNSAFLISADGQNPKPYHKQILMPYGEYTPLGDIFPWMQEMNATAGNFSAGKEVSIFRIPEWRNASGGYAPSISLSPLICYEDVVPSISREATKRGADLLINLTNDAWFGNTVAPFQHHLIALFRAIENRRFLLRATNTGLTAVVSPAGETLVQVPTFSEQTLISDTWAVKEQSIYTSVGDMPWGIMSAINLIFLAKLVWLRWGIVKLRSIKLRKVDGD